MPWVKKKLRNTGVVKNSCTTFLITKWMPTWPHPKSSWKEESVYARWYSQRFMVTESLLSMLWEQHPKLSAATNLCADYITVNNGVLFRFQRKYRDTVALQSYVCIVCSLFKPAPLEICTCPYFSRKYLYKFVFQTTLWKY